MFDMFDDIGGQIIGYKPIILYIYIYVCVCVFFYLHVRIVKFNFWVYMKKNAV